MKFDVLNKPKTIPMDRMFLARTHPQPSNQSSETSSSGGGDGGDDEGEEDPDEEDPEESWETIFSDDFNTENDGADFENWNSLAKWSVPDYPTDTIDLVNYTQEGLGVVLDGQGVAIDLLGTNNCLDVTMESDAISIVSGNFYRLTFKLAGNNRSENCRSTVTITIGGFLSLTLTPLWDQVMTEYEYTFSAESSSSPKISVTCVEIGDLQIPDFGCILDDVVLERRVS